MSVDETLEDRNSVHGDYHDQAAMGEAIREVIIRGKYWPTMTPVQRDALIMIAVKMSRILQGNPNFSDHWHDLQGYARLAEKECVAKHGPIPSLVSLR